MRILSVKANMDPVLGGGTAERTFQMCRCLSRVSGIEPMLLTLDLGLTPERRQQLSIVGLTVLPCANRRYQIPAGGLGQISSLVRSADVIHLMGHWTVLNALVYRQARRFQKAYVMCPAGTLVDFGRSQILKRIYQLMVGREMLKGADCIIAIARNEIPLFEKYQHDSNKVQVIPNGLRLSDYQDRDDSAFRRKCGLGEAPFILFLGRLNPIKGPDLLVEAFARIQDRFPGYNLVLAGPDEGMRARLLEQAENEGIADRLFCPGFLDVKTKSWALHAAELLAIPSRKEAMSIVILEAGATGTPVVFTDQCGLDEVASIGGGFMVPASVEGLATGLEAALTRPSVSREMGQRLKVFTTERFSWESIAVRYVKLFESLSAGEGSP